MSRERARPSHRREQLASELRDVVQDQITRGLSDPRVQGIITVTGVEIDQELSRAIVRVSVLPEKNQAKVMAGLKHGARHLRHKAGEKITTVRIPELIFELDTTLKKQAAVMEALARVAREREARQPVDPGSAPANNDDQPKAGW